MPNLILPSEHPQRVLLNDEVHARPSEAVSPPLRVSYLALFTDWPSCEDDRLPLVDLAKRFDAFPPGPGATHYRADMGRFRLKWERHTEFMRFTFMVSGAGDKPFEDPAISMVPAQWIADLPGEIIMAAHMAMLPASAPPDINAIGTQFFAGNMIAGSMCSGGLASAFTDFRVHGDGFNRILVQDRGMTEWAAGRMVQRLLEIETYRIMALLALPIARELIPFLTESEEVLVDITKKMSEGQEEDEPLLFDSLTQLEASIESRYSENHYRFSAAKAYYDLVKRRIAELREDRLPGLQTFQEFTERRLAPAMSTCITVAEQQEELSERVSRATQLLTTRVEITRANQTQQVLQSMNRRVKVQIRLQETVEGLSVAAISYYVIGILNYAAKGLGVVRDNWEPNLVTALAVPVVLFFVALTIRRARQKLTEAKDDS